MALPWKLFWLSSYSQVEWTILATELCLNGLEFRPLVKALAKVAANE